MPVPTNKITFQSIVDDLSALKEKFGIQFIISLCAKIIFEHCWWNWNTIKHGLLTDPDSTALNKFLEELK